MDLGDQREDTRLLAIIVHSAFYVLLAASLLRWLIRHSETRSTPLIVVLAVALAVLYGLSELRESHRLVWFAALVLTWSVLVVLAPSFAWCAVPLVYTGLRILSERTAVTLVVVLTALVVASQVRIAGWLDPNLVLAPPAVAAVTTALFVGMRRQASRQAALIDDLVRTRQELADTERREGTLAERERLAMEIHDTLAQGLSSQRMLLQAADLVWDTDPGQARTHLRAAAEIADHDLTEARRFVHDLAPADLAAGGSLAAALTALAARESTDTLTVRCHIEGAPVPLPQRVEATLLRIAQGALANVREHAEASTATLTLTTLDDQVVLDVADNGCGFDPEDLGDPAEHRGHGLPAIRARAGQLGGTCAIESAPGEGTVLSVSIPWPPVDPADDR
ncbi:sensor histidine kinase [Nocardia caishijiensis]|uniref:Oxygen sensor histidine kinase NreB n=1 Tax=Nocardia caishijiensis TaxID=184756 RepID=A0ABQ6YL51_9NOCA|nr:sensor histidine kinase [Nocardia caishijiensis]KAF0846517.1 signal transduction histidine kinase [Nocardia caishijiensis]